MSEYMPAAFLSYVHADDKYGHITAFRERLADEVQMQLGIEFPIFQDRKDILWGDNWRQRIEGSLDAVTFLISVITPSFFMSDYCRDELRRFLAREKELGRGDLILPVYFIDTPLLNEEEMRADDELAQAIASRQYADWRELRFEPVTDPVVGKTLAQLARQIRSGLHRTGALKRLKPSPPAPAVPPAEAPDEAATPPVERGGDERPPPSSKSEVPTLIVDPWGRGDHTTLVEATRDANPGDRIVVRPGLYEGELVIDKVLEIIGEGELAEVVVQAQNRTTIVFKASMGRISNLTVRMLGGPTGSAVDITQGRLELEGCDILSQGHSCVSIRGGADPRLRRNRIHGSCQTGVSVYGNGQGTLEDNEIFDNASYGVTVSDGGNPVLRRNRIRNNRFQGVYVYEPGGAVLEENDLRGNGFGGCFISEASKARVRLVNNQV